MRLILLALLVTGCAISGGTIRGTSLEPAHSEQYVSGRVCVAYDPNAYNCTTSIPIYASRWIPDRCWLTVADTEHDGAEGSWVIPCEDREKYVVGRWADRP